MIEVRKKIVLRYDQVFTIIFLQDHPPRNVQKSDNIHESPGSPRNEKVRKELFGSQNVSNSKSILNWDVLMIGFPKNAFHLFFIFLFHTLIDIFIYTWLFNNFFACYGIS